MTNEQQERLKQIRESDQQWRRNAPDLGDVIAGLESDVDFLLSLFDSQAAERREPYSEECRAAIDGLELRFESESVELCSVEYARQRESHGATTMRSRCVETIRNLRPSATGAGAFKDAAIKALERLPLGEQEKRG